MFTVAGERPLDHATEHSIAGQRRQCSVVLLVDAYGEGGALAAPVFHAYGDGGDPLFL